MFKFLRNVRTIIRQGEELCRIREENEKLKIDLTIQKALSQQYKDNFIDLLSNVNANINTKIVKKIKVIMGIETDSEIIVKKIKNVIYDGQINK